MNIPVNANDYEMLLWGELVQLRKLIDRAGTGPQLIHIQLGPVLNQGHGVVQAPVPGEVRADGVPYEVGQLIIGPVELGGVVD